MDAQNEIERLLDELHNDDCYNSLVFREKNGILDEQDAKFLETRRKLRTKLSMEIKSKQEFLESGDFQIGKTIAASGYRTKNDTALDWAVVECSRGRVGKNMVRLGPIQR